MIIDTDKNFTTATGNPIKVTAQTKALAEAIRAEEAKMTGVVKPISAIVGELVYEKAKALGVDK